MLFKILNAVAMTLLVALLATVPAAFLGQFLPGFFNTGLQRIAIAAWVAGLLSWWLARSASRREAEAVHQAHGSSKPQVILGVAFLAVAIGLAVALHFYGDRLLG